MAPTTLTKRFSLSTKPLSKGMVGAIAGGAVFVFLFIVGLVVFLVFYARFARKPNKAHVGPYAIFPAKGGRRGGEDDVEARGGGEEEAKSLGDSSTLVGTPNSTPPATITKPPPDLKLAMQTPPASPNRDVEKPEPERPQTPTAAAARSQTAVTPKRGRTQHLAAEEDQPWNSVASSGSLEQPATPGRTFV